MNTQLPRRLSLVAVSLAAVLVLGACAYRIPIQQGNYVDPDAVAKIKPGMTRTQVRYLLGTPMIPGAFDKDRWDYDYYLRLRRGFKPIRSHATVYFSNDKVERVESDAVRKAEVPISSRPASAPGS